MEITVGTCLAKYRIALGWEIKQAAIETMLTVSAANIGRIENGGVKNPGVYTIIKLLNAYGKTLADLNDDLMGNITPIKRIASSNATVKTIPVISIDDVENFINGNDYNVIERLPAKNGKSLTYFAIIMSNDMMRGDGTNTYPKGSYAIFQPTNTFKNNHDVLIEIDNKITFKRIVKEDDELYIKTLNNSYRAEKLDMRPKTFGKAIECRIPRKYS